MSETYYRIILYGNDNKNILSDNVYDDKIKATYQISILYNINCKQKNSSVTKHIDLNLITIEFIQNK